MDLVRGVLAPKVVLVIHLYSTHLSLLSLDGTQGQGTPGQRKRGMRPAVRDAAPAQRSARPWGHGRSLNMTSSRGRMTSWEYAYAQPLGNPSQWTVDQESRADGYTGRNWVRAEGTAMRSRTARQRYCRCGARLAADNTNQLCARCQRASRDKYIAPLQVPPEFWHTELLRMAFAAQHMGQVARAYRLHPYHQAVYGPGGISQGLLGQWLGVQQPQVSRIETGPPIRDLNKLAYLARVLGIPAGMLWFDLPGDTRQAALHSLGGSKSDCDASNNPHRWRR
jgi:hypothetical protein